jgi:hypothetical protein
MFLLIATANLPSAEMYLFIIVFIPEILVSYSRRSSEPSDED